MTVLVFEDNLMWSARLKRSLESLGHEAVVLTALPEPLPAAEAAIVNLGSERMPVEAVQAALRGRGVRVIGHAGHKEKGLLDRGREAGCDAVVSNSTLTFRLDKVLEGTANPPEMDEDDE